jgi:hypothetical protein
VLLDSNVAKKTCLLLLSNNFSSESFSWRNAQSAAANVFLVNPPLQSCRRSRIIDQDKGLIFDLALNITGELKMAPKTS